MPLRYWALCRTFAEQGHEVIWWSSDFSHLHKAKRKPCPDTDGFSVRLIETPPYTKNISFARLKNHKAFAGGFYQEAMAGLKSGELEAPDRIVLSLPPLGVAEQALRIRDHVNNRSAQLQQANQLRENTEQQTKRSLKRRATAPPHQPSIISHPPTQRSCQVIVDIMDAWPETFYQALPKPLRKFLGPILLAPMHRSAKRAYQGADKISAVGQSYLDLASRYLGQKWKVEKSVPRSRATTRPDAQRTGPSGKDGRSCALQPQHLEPEATKKTTAKARRYGHQPSTNNNQQPTTPTHLCYHGTDLSRFAQKPEVRGQGTEDSRQRPDDRRTAPPSHDGGHNRGQEPGKSPLNQQPTTNNSQPLRAVYLGSMGSGYDLQTIIDVAARWKAEGVFPFQIHFAGDGPQRKALKARCEALGLLSEDRGQETETSSERSDKTGCKADRTSQTPDDAGIHQAGEERSEQPSHLNTFPPSHDSSSIDIPRIVFHGHLAKTPITVLLESSHLALVPNRPQSLVACPYKAGEYAAAGLPMISCLKGELGELLNQWDAGSEYNEGDAASLQAAFKKYSTDVELLNQQSLNAREMAEALFDRKKTYQKLAEFILDSSFRR